MGVYISGLEMPQNGRITLQIDSNGGVYVVNKFNIISEKYEKSMTATGIQPHGRLIDASQRITVAIPNGLKCVTVDKFIDEYAVRNAPTVIEAED